MAVSEKGVKTAKEMSGMKSGTLGESGQIANLEKELKFIEKGLDNAETTLEIEKLNKKKKKIMDQLGMTNKEGKGTDFGMLSVKAGIDNNPKPTQADRIAGATKGDKKVAKGGVRTAIAKIKKAKDGARTGVRGTGAAKRGFRKARLS